MPSLMLLFVASDNCCAESIVSLRWPVRASFYLTPRLNMPNLHQVSCLPEYSDFYRRRSKTFTVLEDITCVRIMNEHSFS